MRGVSDLNHRAVVLGAGPCDVVFDDATLQCVTGDPEKVGSFDNAASLDESRLAKEFFGRGEVE